MDPNIQHQESSQHEHTGKMYSYQEENNVNNNNSDHLQDAIRRSIGGDNPNVNYPKQNYNNLYSQNNVNTNVEIVQNQENYYKNSIRNNNPFSYWIPYIIVVVLEVITIILIGCLFNWDIRNAPNNSDKKGEKGEKGENEDKTIDEHINGAIDEEMREYEGLFRDINIMVFAGFGMFHTLLKRFSWTSIAINLIAIAISFQIGLITNLIWGNAFKEKWTSGVLNFSSFTKSIVNSSSVLVSLGCVFGKLTNSQYLIMIILETIMCSLNFQLCDIKIKAVDLGALYIHTFGALFGSSIYMVLFYSSKMKSKKFEENYYNKSNYFSNLTSFVGILFLWCYFPSFNSGLVPYTNARYRACINTYFSLAGGVVGSFIFSFLFYKGRVVMEHILFGSFSGGVIISGCCSVCIDHWAALLIGFIGGFIAVLFLDKIKPSFINWKYYDIYNILYIHGIPGLLGAFITPMMIGNLKMRIGDEYYYLLSDFDRGNDLQASIQVGAIFVTIGLAFASGISIGYLIKVSTCGKIEKYFIDSEIFEKESNLIDNVEQNEFFVGDITRASLFQNRIDFPPERGSQPSYN